jgi:MFS family permease
VGSSRVHVLRRLLANPPLAHGAMSFGAWIAGEAAALIVVSIVVFGEGGIVAVGIAGAARVLPVAFATVWGAFLVDRYSRVELLAGMHFISAVLLALLSLAAHWHLPLLVIYALVAVGAVLSAPFRPATSALMPQLLVRSDDLWGANSVYSTMEAAGTLLGSALAGALLVIVAPPMVLVALALLAFAGALITLRIRPHAHQHAASAGHRVRDLAACLELLVRDPRLNGIFSLFMAQTVMRGLLNVFVVAAAVSLLDLGESGAAALLSVVGVGGLLGAVLGLAPASGARLTLAFSGGVAAWGLATLAIALWPTPTVAWVVLAALGLGNALEDVAGLTLMQRLIPEHQLGRAFGVLHGAASACLAVGSIAAPVLISLFGLRGAMGASGALLIALVVILWRRMRVTSSPTESAAEGLALSY